MTLLLPFPLLIAQGQQVGPPAKGRPCSRATLSTLCPESLLFYCPVLLSLCRGGKWALLPGEALFPGDIISIGRPVGGEWCRLRMLESEGTWRHSWQAGPSLSAAPFKAHTPVSRQVRCLALFAAHCPRTLQCLHAWRIGCAAPCQPEQAAVSHWARRLCRPLPAHTCRTQRNTPPLPHHVACMLPPLTGPSTEEAKVVPADCLLLDGTCIAEEAVLTGACAAECSTCCAAPEFRGRKWGWWTATMEGGAVRVPLPQYHAALRS